MATHVLKSMGGCLLIRSSFPVRLFKKQAWCHHPSQADLFCPHGRQRLPGQHQEYELSLTLKNFLLTPYMQCFSTG